MSNIPSWAWIVQAVITAIGIALAGYWPIWHQKINRRSIQKRSLRSAILLLDDLSRTAQNVDGKIQTWPAVQLIRPPEAMETIKVAIGPLRQFPLHDFDDPRAAKALLGALELARDFADATNVFEGTISKELFDRRRAALLQARDGIDEWRRLFKERAHALGAEV